MRPPNRLVALSPCRLRTTSGRLLRLRLGSLRGRCRFCLWGDARCRSDLSLTAAQQKGRQCRRQTRCEENGRQQHQRPSPRLRLFARSLPGSRRRRGPARTSADNLNPRGRRRRTLDAPARCSKTMPASRMRTGGGVLRNRPMAVRARFQSWHPLIDRQNLARP